MTSKFIKANCPICKNPIAVDYSKGDNEITCPSCKKTISVKFDENFKETKQIINNFGK